MIQFQAERHTLKYVALQAISSRRRGGGGGGGEGGYRGVWTSLQYMKPINFFEKEKGKN